jgi:hypothetical protein
MVTSNVSPSFLLPSSFLSTPSPVIFGLNYPFSPVCISSPKNLQTLLTTCSPSIAPSSLTTPSPLHDTKTTVESSVLTSIALPSAHSKSSPPKSDNSSPDVLPPINKGGGGEENKNSFETQSNASLSSSDSLSSTSTSSFHSSPCRSDNRYVLSSLLPPSDKNTNMNKCAENLVSNKNINNATKSPEANVCLNPETNGCLNSEKNICLNPEKNTDAHISYASILSPRDSLSESSSSPRSFSTSPSLTPRSGNYSPRVVSEGGRGEGGKEDAERAGGLDQPSQIAMLEQAPTTTVPTKRMNIV